MTADQLDAYIAMLFSRHDEFGAAYVARQVEWAEAKLQKLLPQKSSFMADGCAPGEGGVSSPSAATSVIVAR